jgi:hypothetical protein
MAEFQIPPSKLISLIKMTPETIYNEVKIQNKLSDSFMTNTDVRRRLPLHCPWPYLTAIQML